jgi:uncharacterized SAM-binding protein YcdF (DUF218 family)
MFLLKKLVSPFILPVPICIGLMALGLFLLWFTRRQQAGKIAVTLGTFLLALMGIRIFSEMLVGPLEARYPPIGLGSEPLAASASENDPVRWIVVLSGGHVPDPRVPETSQISRWSLVRLIEGIRLHREMSGTKLLLTGGGFYESVSESETMAKIAGSLGVDPERIVIETESRDTKDQAHIVRSVVGGSRFVLVTSSWHMPRSMAIFRKAGLDPIPAPTGHLVRRGLWSPGRLFLPCSSGLRRTEIAVHEYLGLLWAKLRGQI